MAQGKRISADIPAAVHDAILAGDGPKARAAMEAVLASAALQTERLTLAAHETPRAG